MEIELKHLTPFENPYLLKGDELDKTVQRRISGQPNKGGKTK